MDIRRSVIRAIDKHAYRDLPNECCGLVLGTSTLIAHAVAARNLEASPTRYLIDPADHFSARRYARIRGWEVVGAYHSHPWVPAVPSSADISEANYRDFVYLILSVGNRSKGSQMRGFRLVCGSVTQVQLIPVP